MELHDYAWILTHWFIRVFRYDIGQIESDQIGHELKTVFSDSERTAEHFVTCKQYKTYCASRSGVFVCY